MGRYNLHYLCKRLCEMYNESLDCLSLLEDKDRLERYLWAMCDACFVYFEPEDDRFAYAEFCLYDKDDISIRVHGLFVALSGYWGEERVYDVDMDESVIGLMEKLAEDRWRAIRDLVSLEVLDTDVPRVKAVNILE